MTDLVGEPGVAKPAHDSMASPPVRFPITAKHTQTGAEHKLLQTSISPHINRRWRTAMKTDIGAWLLVLSSCLTSSREEIFIELNIRIDIAIVLLGPSRCFQKEKKNHLPAILTLSLVFHHNDTHIYVFYLAFALSINNKQTIPTLPGASEIPTTYSVS